VWAFCLKAAEVAMCMAVLVSRVARDLHDFGAAHDPAGFVQSPRL